MNSNSIKELVDVGLYSSIAEAFQKNCLAPKWLIQYERNEVRRNFSIREFYDIAGSTTDLREMRAIALFVWFYDLDYPEFICRCLDVLQKHFDVFLEAVCYNTCVLEQEQKGIFREMLMGAPRDSVLEFLVALLALGDVIDTTRHRFVMACCSLLNENRLDVIEDAPIYVQLIEEGSRLLNCPELIKAFQRYEFKVPVYGDALYSACAYWGYTYLEQLMLCFILQGFSDKRKAVRNNKKKKEQLFQLLLKHLGLSKVPWTDGQARIVLTVYRSAERKYSIINAQNLRICIDNGIAEYFKTELDYSGMLDELLTCQADTAYELLEEVLATCTDENLVLMWSKYRGIFEMLFSRFRDKLVSVYNVLLEKGCDVKQFVAYYANYLSDFKDKSSVELLHVLCIDRESEAYQRLMNQCVLNTKFGKKENAFIREEVEKFVMLYCPERYESVFGGDDNE